MRNSVAGSRGIGGRVAAFSLAAVLAFACSAVVAFASSPHVTSTLDTDRCAACHDVHSATNPVLLRVGPADDPQTELCFGCHNGSSGDVSNVASGTADSFSQPSGHKLYSGKDGSAPIAGCATCHDPHGSSQEARRILVAPGKGSAPSGSTAFCLACHGTGADAFGSGYPATSAPTRDETGYPVAGTWPGAVVYAGATNAHRLIPEATRTVGVSEPIRREQGDCLYCHAAHGGRNAYDGLVDTYTVPAAATLASDTTEGTYAAVCFECHGGVTPSGFATQPVDIKRYVTASGGTGGHTIITSGGVLPVGSPLPCFECHNPHGSARGNDALLSDELGGSLSTTTSAGVRAYCFTCHTTSDTAAGWSSADATLTPVSASEKVVGLPRDGAVLRLPGGDGHAAADTDSCYECHGSSYAEGGNNVHNPIDGNAARFTLAIVSQATTSTVASGSPDSTASTGATSSVSATDSVATSSTVLPDLSLGATDSLAPVTLSDAVSTYSVTATITLVATDNVGGSGVAATYYSLDGGEAVTGTVVATSAPGPHTLVFWSVDVAGNVELPTTVAFDVLGYQASAINAWVNRAYLFAASGENTS